MKKEKRVMTVAEKKKRRKRIRRIILCVVLAIIILYIILVNAASKQQINIVEVTKPVIGNVEELVNTSGFVASEEVKTYFAPTMGRLDSIDVQAGDEVKAGSLLAAYDIESLEKNMEQANLQYTASHGTYSESLASNKDAQSKLSEANINIPILDQQIDDTKNYIKALQDELEKLSQDTTNKLSAESFELQKKLLELQKDPITNANAIAEVQIAIQTNQYNAQMAGTSKKQTEYREKIEEQQEILAGYQEYKAEMEAQKQKAEINALSSSQKTSLSATEKLNEITRDAAQENFDKASAGITADFTGIVTSITAVEGATVTEGMQLFTLESSERVKVVINVTKYDLPKIAIGQKADVTINGKVYEGTIAKINRMATMSNTGTSSVGVEVHIENPDENVYLGLDAKVVISTDKAENVITIPVEALNADKQGDFVYVLENGIAVRRTVITGIASSEYIEIKEGVQESDVIILSSLTGMVIEEGAPVYMLPATINAVE